MLTRLLLQGGFAAREDLHRSLAGAPEGPYEGFLRESPVSRRVPPQPRGRRPISDRGEQPAAPSAPQAARRARRDAVQVHAEARRQSHGDVGDRRWHAFFTDPQREGKRERGPRAERVGPERRVQARGHFGPRGGRGRHDAAAGGEGEAQPHFLGQGIVRFAMTVEPSWKLNCEATGQPPFGQLLGRMMPLTWNSRRLPWIVL